MKNQRELSQKSDQQQKDPYGVSYDESAAKYLFYRISIAIFAVVMIVIGKSNLPDDSVTCIEDGVIDFLRPVTVFYTNNQPLGLFFMTIMQLVVDAQLIGMALFWYFKGDSFRYPLVICALGVSKILLNILFEIRPIEGSFNQMLFPSLIFGENFKSTYFFSGVTTFLMFNLLEFWKMRYFLLMKVQIGVLIYCIFMLLSMRQNFFMDIATALVFGHFVFIFIHQRSKTLDRFIESLIGKDTQEKEDEI